MATSENGTGKSKKDRKQEFFVHADKFGVLVNYREVHAARLEGRSADAEAHYFSKGDKIALSEDYIEKQNISRLFRDSALDANTGLPPIEPIELYEKRKQIEGKLAEASRAHDADAAKLAGERDKARRELQEEFERHKAATILEEFAAA